MGKAAIDLEEIARKLHPIIVKCFHDFEAGVLSGCDLVGIYILLFLASRRPRGWSGGRLHLSIADHGECTPNSVALTAYPSVVEVLDANYICKITKSSHEQLTSVTVLDIFRHQRFVGIKCNGDNYVNQCMVMWYMGKRPVRLLSYIPSPTEVLRQQARGERVVTIFTTVEELSQMHRSKLTYMDGMIDHDRDPLEFTIHDLKHMEFYVRTDIREEQQGFFQSMLSLGNGRPREFFRCRGHDLQLWQELEYVISDMNCHSTHLLRYLFAKLQLSCQRNASTVMATLGWSDGVDRDVNDMLRAVWTDVLLAMGLTPADGLAYSAAVRLVDVTASRGSDLSVEEWEAIRDFFKSRSHSCQEING